MKQLIAVLVMLAFAAPVRAQLPSGFEPVEKPLIEKQKLEEDMSRDIQKSRQAEPQKKEEEKGSNWWKWALGIVIVGGGIAAAAGGGGGGGGGDGGTPDGGNGTIHIGW